MDMRDTMDCLDCIGGVGRCVCVGVFVFFTLTDRASTISSNITRLPNPIRGLLDRKRSEKHHLQVSIEGIKTKAKTGKERRQETHPIHKVDRSAQGTDT